MRLSGQKSLARSQEKEIDTFSIVEPSSGPVKTKHRILRHCLLATVVPVIPAAVAQTATPAPVTPASVKTPPSSARHRAPVGKASAPKEETVKVIGRVATGTTAQYSKKTADLGPLGDRPSVDSPFSIMTVTHDVIVNQQARNINDLARYMPSVQLEERGDPNTSRPQSRGFESDVIANSRVDGLNMVSTTPYAAEQFEDMQVLNGLAGALYGPQNPAGTFSYSLKRPTDRMTERFTAGVDSIGAPLEALDASGRVGHHGWFGYRLNLLNQTGESFVRDSHLRRNLVSGDFDFHISPNTVIQVDASQYTFAQRGYPGGFSYKTGIQLPNAPDLSRYGYGQSYEGFNMETDTALTKIIHHFNKDWTLTAGGLYQNAARQVFATTNTLTDSFGNYKTNIAAAATANDFRAGSNTLYVNGRFHTGPLRHEIMIGSNGYMMGNYNPTKGETFVLGSGNIANPTIFEGKQPYYSGHYKSASVLEQSLIASDTIWFDKHWAIMGTLGWSWLSEHNYNVHSVQTSQYRRSAAFSPMTSLMYKVSENQTAYFTWGRSLEAGPIAPNTVTNANSVLAPLRSEEWEVGYKYRFENGLQLNAAGFRMSRPYAYTDPTTNTYGTFGNQRNYGVEFQASGAITRDISVLGGVTWMDAQLGSTGTTATSHKEVVGVPPVQASALIDYHPAWAKGAAANAAIHYVGRRAGDVENKTFADSYVTLDLGVRYTTHAYKTPIAFRFGVNNVANERYWASVYPSSVNGLSSANNSAVAGLPRTYSFTTEIDF